MKCVVILANSVDAGLFVSLWKVLGTWKAAPPAIPVCTIVRHQLADENVQQLGRRFLISANGWVYIMQDQ